MPASGAILDSTIIPMRSADIPQTTTRGSLGHTTMIATPPDDREIFKVYFVFNKIIKYLIS